ncbi:hypothetical protein LSUB1_G003284 [Lachnellula subtilissima]|uniref:Uncharacterized protein n=1 Tax=Lachnellula subtilissima TaxID=602034 RepID=A0A8H8RVK5_9HELO|nr:hypothetical protein LSUB1_G003284 [Lachnellula subtilissima]
MECPSRLEGLYQTWQNLRPTSPPEQFHDFGAFFDDSCTAWLKSMREWDQPSIGRQAIIDNVKTNIQSHHIEERRVQSSLVSEDGRTVMCEMRNRLDVLGTPLDNFYETAVASPIVGVVQTVTGKGPYTAAAAKQEFEHVGRHSNRQVASTKLAQVSTPAESQCCRDDKDRGPPRFFPAIRARLWKKVASVLRILRRSS